MPHPPSSTNTVTVSSKAPYNSFQSKSGMSEELKEIRATSLMVRFKSPSSESTPKLNLEDHLSGKRKVLRQIEFFEQMISAYDDSSSSLPPYNWRGERLPQGLRTSLKSSSSTALSGRNEGVVNSSSLLSQVAQHTTPLKVAVTELPSPLGDGALTVKAYAFTPKALSPSSQPSSASTQPNLAQSSLQNAKGTGIGETLQTNGSVNPYTNELRDQLKENKQQVTVLEEGFLKLLGNYDKKSANVLSMDDKAKADSNIGSIHRFIAEIYSERKKTKEALDSGNINAAKKYLKNVEIYTEACFKWLSKIENLNALKRTDSGSETPHHRTLSVDSDGYKLGGRDTRVKAFDISISADSERAKLERAKLDKLAKLDARHSKRLQQVDWAKQDRPVKSTELVAQMDKVKTQAENFLQPSNSSFIRNKVAEIITLANKALAEARGDNRTTATHVQKAEQGLKLLADINSLMKEIYDFQTEVIESYRKRHSSKQHSSVNDLEHKRAMRMRDEVIDAAAIASKDASHGKLTSAQKHFEEIKNFHEQAIQDETDAKKNHIVFKAKIKKIKTDVRNIQPNLKIKRELLALVEKASEAERSGNLKLAGKYADLVEKRLLDAFNKAEPKRDDIKAVAVDHEKPTAAQASPKANQAERDKLVEKMERIKAEAEEIRKRNPNDSFTKLQCDGIIKLATEASKAAESKTITVVRVEAGKAERRLRAFMKRAFVKEMEELVKEMKNFLLGNPSNPSIKSNISEAIQVAESALSGVRTGKMKSAEQDARLARYSWQKIMQEVK